MVTLIAGKNNITSASKLNIPVSGRLIPRNTASQAVTNNPINEQNRQKYQYSALEALPEELKDFFMQI
jgi:hypothetical protein